MHHQRISLDGGLAAHTHEPPRLHVADVAQPHHILNSHQAFQLPLGQCRGLRHGGSYPRIDTQHYACRLHVQEEFVRRRRLAGRLQDVGHHAQIDVRIGLHNRTVEHPGISRTQPADRVRVHTVVEQPEPTITN